MLRWLTSKMVVAKVLGLLDNYMIGSLRRSMYFLGDCMTTPLALRIL